MWNNLRIRLTIIFIGLAIGPLLLVGVILAQRSFATELEQALDLQYQVAQRVSTEMEVFLHEIENDFRLLGREIRDLEQPDRAQQMSLLLGAFSIGKYRDVYEEFVLLDEQGREQLRLSQQEIIAADELGDRSRSDEFVQPKESGQTYFSPVWFDERTGEPLMTIAIPLFELRSVQLNGVLVAAIRFKTVGYLITDLRASKGQTIYVVDPESRVVAHQDPSIALPELHFKVPEQGGRQTGMDGLDVILAVDRVQLGAQGFTIVAERPVSEALELATNTVFTIVATIVVALVIAGSLVFLIVRQIVRPIETLASTAEAISAGDLSQQVEVTSRDEIGELAGAFNYMTAQLRDLIDTLEDRIYERTRALATTAEISRQATAILDLDELLQYAVNRIQTEFNFYHTHIYLVEAETGDLVMSEGSGEVGRQLKERGHRLPAGQGIVGTVAETNDPFISNNVDEVLNFVRNPLLPNTGSELAVPLRKGEQVLGVLDIQSDQKKRFTSEDITLMQSLANQIAIAVDNARLLAETQTALRQVERLNRRLTHEAWEESNQVMTVTGYRFREGISQAITSDLDTWLSPMKRAAVRKHLVKQTYSDNGNKSRAELAIPLMLRGEVIGILGVKRDETSDWAEEEVSAVEAVADQVSRALENARLTKEQQKTIVQLKEVDRLKSDFLTSMSHELRTPLNSIIGFADVLLQGIDGELPDLAMNDIRLIHSSGRHLLALINDILDLSKIEAGKMELVREALNVREVLDDALAASSSLIKDKPVQIVAEAADVLPPVYADKLRFNQILLNLISNAAKFTEEGKITIKAVVQDQSPEKMLISITDTGIGIPPEKLDTIFDRFRQADSSTTRQYGGTGLGLPICKNLIEMHGGTLRVASKVGVGSTFYFTVPVADAITIDENESAEAEIVSLA